VPIGRGTLESNRGEAAAAAAAETSAKEIEEKAKEEAIMFRRAVGSLLARLDGAAVFTAAALTGAGGTLAIQYFMKGLGGDESGGFLFFLSSAVSCQDPPPQTRLLVQVLARWLGPARR
jgi:hypothetical protein